MIERENFIRVILKVKYIVLLLSTCFTFSINAQDAQFTQFFSNSLFLAPSFAGKTVDHRVGVTYRNQWPGYHNGFQTYTLSYDHFIPKYSSGIGVLFFRDIAGASQLGNTAGSVLYSYDAKLSHIWHLRPGVSFGVNYFGYNHDNLVFWDQIANGEKTESSIIPQPGLASSWDIDAAASLIAFSDNYWFGMSVDHLFKPNQGFYNDSKIPYKWSFFGGTKISPKSRVHRRHEDYFALAYLYKRQADFQQLDMGVYWCNNSLVLGFWYRGIPIVNSYYGDAFAMLIGYKTDRYSLGYSYDVTISSLIGSRSGAHELSLQWEFKTKKKKKHKAIPCPDF
jgi:type IX secretion system PorP/SprF family membrane protein